MNSKPIKVLLIEDNPGDACLMQEALLEPGDDSITLEVINTLAASLHRVRARGIDIILLDLSLPDGVAYETFAGAKAEALGVAIIILSGSKDDSLALKLVQSGAQ